MSALNRVVENFFSKETLAAAADFLREARLRTTRSAMLHGLCLVIIAIIAFTTRILPLRWGAYLSEFDPYYHYRVTNYIVSYGFQAFFTWFDRMSWYPYGRNIALTTPPGLPFTGAVIYLLLRSLGLSVSVLDVCIYLPPVMGVITCLIVYYFARDMGNKEVGLFAALFLALNPAYISRTYLGFYKHETIGVFAIVLASLLFTRSIDLKRSIISSTIYFIAAGLTLGYLNVSWGAFYYAVDLIALFTLVLIALRRYSTRLLLSYCVVMVISLALATSVPRPGYSVLYSAGILPVYIVLVILCACELARHVTSLKNRAILATSIMTIAIITFVILYTYGFISPLMGKMISVLNPLARLEMPIVQSVAEHRPATWAAFYYEFGILVFLAPIGFLFAAQRPTNQNLYATIFGITALYFAASMVRLTLILAPAFCILGAIATAEIIKPFIDIIRGVTIFPRRKVRFVSRVGPEFGVVFILVIFLMLLPTLMRGIEGAYQPVTIASSTVPVRQYYGDWLEACAWLYSNTPSDAVICSWWDYGYYITVLANRTSLADNATLNSTQIKNIALIYLSDEIQALPILQRYHVSYVVVFTTIWLGTYYGDEVKWSWMAKIAGLNDTQLVDNELTSMFRLPISLPNRNFVITKLILYGLLTERTTMYGLPRPDHFTLVYSSSNKLVFIYKVIY
ncbi:hypothetical protein KEJ26_06015 [Candidatus Bathyarchaeota archaeon]|nr:hypothetical protein [Candidatus Bathyarchaeota archaeon]